MTLADQAAITGHDGQVTSGGKPGRPKRRTFTAAYKARILAEFDAASLDRWGLADVSVDWPADALLRPIAAGDNGPFASLVTLSPAGVLDARFLPALSALG